jgi:hypothetical protein
VQGAPTESGSSALGMGPRLSTWTDTGLGHCREEYGSDTVKTDSHQLNQIILKTAFRFLLSFFREVPLHAYR